MKRKLINANQTDLHSQTPSVASTPTTTLNRTSNPTTTGNCITTPNLTTIPKPKTPFGNITATTDETPENNRQSTQNRSTPDAQQEEIKKKELRVSTYVLNL
jgi:hypothetical protein